MGEKGFEGTEHRSGSLEHAGEDAPRYAIDNPGLPPHRPRLADEDPKAAKRAGSPAASAASCNSTPRRSCAPG